jgi:tetratricopeptide (TPR) repeat protein
MWESKSIEELIVELSKDPFNPLLNFNVGMKYEAMNQPASAVSFFLRCAEYGEETHTEEVYCSLLKLAKCFTEQNDQNARLHTVSNSLLQAVAYEPSFPEAYMLLSQYYERKNEAWQESYTWASLGLDMAKDGPSFYAAQLGYGGEYALQFQKGLAGYYIGRKEEALKIFNQLDDIPDLPTAYKTLVQNNIGYMHA